MKTQTLVILAVAAAAVYFLFLKPKKDGNGSGQSQHMDASREVTLPQQRTTKAGDVLEGSASVIESLGSALGNIFG